MEFWYKAGFFFNSPEQTFIKKKLNIFFIKLKISLIIRADHTLK